MKRTIQRVSSISLVLFCLAGLVTSVQPVTRVRAQETQPQESAVLQDICTSDLLIMPLGDSITQGSSSEVSEASKMISYRKDLWDSLKKAGYLVDFVGSQTNGQFYLGDHAKHEGHSGWGANDIRDNVYSFLFTLPKPARVVLLHIGTNDLNSGQPPQEVVNEVGQILDNIDLYEDNTGNPVTVLLARIILHVDGNDPWIEFNNKLQQMAEARIAAGDDLIVVNQESGAGLIYKVQPAGDMYDNGKNTLHPYHTGYTKMAVVWKQAIESLYQDCNQAPQVTNPGNQSSPEGARVSLKIQATDPDNNTLIYSAQNLPPDLSIAQSTGVISGQISLNAAQGSPYQVKVTVTDNGKPSRSSQVSFSWTVLPRQEVFLPLALFRKK